jgi:ATP-dependent helicase/nuclease subunit B
VAAEPFFRQPRPRWFTIAAHRPFVEDLAAGLYAALSPLGPDALADAVVLAPTRRAVRALTEAFLHAAGGRALLLPQIRALGDLDEGEPPFEPGDLALDLPPAISPWRRRFELARLVSENGHLFERSLDASASLELADALAGFLDSVEIDEAAPLEHLDDWVEAELARHWKISADFLRLAVEEWPLRLAAMGLVDPTARRVMLLKALAERWRSSPPPGVLVAAGSTGSAPATAALLEAIALAPQGCVVLPGLDQDLADAAWAQVGDQHPQGAMKRLLDQAGVTRAQVRNWSPPAPGDARGRWRRRIINEALRPAEATADWLGQIGRIVEEGAAAGVDPIAEGLAGLSLVSARTEDEAAGAVALLLREALETPGRTAALITPDAVLARRVSARLARWGVVVDSSAGAPLASFAVAGLAALIVRAVVDPVDPVLLLAILKHPLVGLGLEPEVLETRRAALERHGLRGPRPADWPAIAGRLERASEPRGEEAAAPQTRIAEAEEAARLLPVLRAALETAREPYTGGTATPAEAARALAAAMEQLATGPDGGAPGDLWAGAGGEAAAGLLSALMGESDGLPETTHAQFADLLEGLIAGEMVRTGAGSHPRLHILGAIESRLVRADLLVLAGLEEGVWPAGAPVDPFLSRPMRKAAGLASPERRIGLSAHDFAQAACAPEVVLLHTERQGGAPAVESRWLWRLRTLARGANTELPSRPELLDWVRALDAPIEPSPENLKTAPRPRPTPPVDIRPRRMSVTAVERWVRDPYAVYAREILKLRPLERPDEQIEARARGTAIHAAFERFAREHPDALPGAPETVFAAMLVEALADAGMPTPRMTREHALAANVAPWVVEFERRRRPGARLLIEQGGRHVLRASAGDFTLTARADRVEVRDGGADILDFKTGAAPSKRQVTSGLSPQLTLTAAILRHGGFADAGALEPGELVYVRVSGGRIPGQEIQRAAAGESADMAMQALDGLARRIASFDERATPYVSWAAPQFMDEYGGDYDHLARLWEWHVIGEAEGDGGGE